ncbi:MAG: NAD-dependent epimerase/dehydratase family protein, partial [Bacteroidales bacterium]
MKYFITGATGFIGSNLAQTLAERGNEVRALVRNREKALETLNHENIQWFYGTLDDKDILKKAMEGIDGVFHLAAYAKPWAKDPTLYNKINLIGTLNVFEIAKEQKVKRIVFTSTGGTFGRTRP